MNVTPQSIPDILVIEPAVFGDARGFFLEGWSAKRYAEAGISGELVQDNVSLSRRGILRGLHVQNPNAQGKLVQVLAGQVFDVAVDVRRGSVTFGAHVAVLLSSENHRQMWIPPGFAHGFYVMSDTALFQYKCSQYYSPASEFSIRWDDPDLAIQWPCQQPVLSKKDAAALRLAEVPGDRLNFPSEERWSAPAFC